MATLALSYAGGAIGNMLLPGLGGIIGKAIGAIGGAFIDNKLFGTKTTAAQVDPNRFKVTTSTEGRAIPRLYGRARVGGEVIWSTYFLRIPAKSGGGKSSVGSALGFGGGSSSSSAAPQDHYYANWAVALCEGPITRLGQVWADGKLLNLANYTYRLYYGDNSQLPDGLIQAKEGGNNTPAYRGVAYIVFELMDLTAFGNRLPQITAEVYRAVDNLEGDIRAVTMIPAAGEFDYDSTEIVLWSGPFIYANENVHTNEGVSDFDASLNDLSSSLPGATTISLFAAWFGTDLRAGSCALTPKVENATKDTGPYEWAVGGLTRDSAPVVSYVSGAPAFGGTPSDLSVIHGIQDMHGRGFAVSFTPFILMDIPQGNVLPDPYTGATGQGPYPWRGRITKQYSTADKTSAVATEVAAFVSQYTNFIMHYANLCASAGGVEGFVIGSEMRGLTWLRSAEGVYPFVTALASLAASVKAVLPSAKVTYAADWSEWFGHQPADGSGDVFFHLDPLWSNSNIDAIGIDCYWPLSDWRTGTGQLDYAAGWRDARDMGYLTANVQGGEGYDWYYASYADRIAQNRTPITDGAYGKPWVFRYKDIRNWWLNQHYNRPAGVQSGSATAWTPQSKPVWFTEFGCPAVDRGANQPNVFYDPKSSESFLPYFSMGNRDDLMQRVWLKTMLSWFQNGANNPTSGVYGGQMVDQSRMFVYTWDARPYPAFPNDTTTWSNSANWQLGHWLTGRMGGAPLAQTVAAILSDSGFGNYDVSGLTGSMQGFLVEQVASPRTSIDVLSSAFFFDAVESNGEIYFRQRGLEGVIASYTRDGMVEEQAGNPVYQLTRAQETELPLVVKVTYTDCNKSYNQGSADARRMVGGSKYVARADLPIIMDFDMASGIAQTWLHEAWSQRESLTATLPPSQLFVEAGDMVTITTDGGVARNIRVTDVSIGQSQQIQGLSIEPHVYGGYDPPVAPTSYTAPAAFGAPATAFLDLPLITGAENPYAGQVAAFASPWPGGESFWRSPSTMGYTLNVVTTAQATMGVTQNAFYAGPTGHWDDGNVLQVQLYYGQLVSVSDIDLLNGANMAAVQTSAGVWEIIQFGTATLVSAGIYQLSHLLRGQYGTEAAMLNPAAAGAQFVMLDNTIAQTNMTAADRNLAYNWQVGPVSQSVGGASFVTTQVTFTGVGLRPYAPCHITGTRDGSGNLTLAWIRRDRDPAADSWESIEIPMSEVSESYQIDIVSGSTVKRTIAASSPTAAYTAAQQTADFGATQSSIAVNVYQISQTFGRGSPGIATV